MLTHYFMAKVAFSVDEPVMSYFINFSESFLL